MMKRDEKIAKLLKEHGKQSPPSLDFTEMVMAQINEEVAIDLDVVRTLVSGQKEDLIHSPSLAFETELFGKIAQQNTKARVRPVFSQNTILGLVASLVLLSITHTFVTQGAYSQFINYEKYIQVFQNSTSVFILVTAIIIGGGMYVLDYVLRERLLLKL